MRKFIILAAALAAVLAIPGSALAQRNGGDCSYTGVAPAAGVTVDLAGDGNVANTSGDDITAVGACLNLPTPAGTFQGGTIEVGTGADGTYAIVDGDDDNDNAAGDFPHDGYIGLSNYTGDSANCDENATGNGGHNGGGCLGLKDDIPGIGGQGIPLGDAVPTPICGDDTGDQWEDSSRDGCAIPF